MKTIFLSLLFALVLYSSQACSCIYISDYFCPTTSWYNANGGSNTFYIAQVKVVSRYGYYMDVQVVDNLQNTLPENELTILGQDGLNCNEWLNPFQEGAFYIVAIYKSNWEEGPYDLNGCGRFWLPVIDEKVQGNIAPDISQQSYEEFKQQLAGCAAILSTDGQVLNAVHAFPNPTTGDLHLSGLEPGTAPDYMLCNLAGQVLSSGTITNTNGMPPVLSLEGLSEGLYILRLQAGEAVLTRRVLLKRK
ncbi:MAG: T9SS type A sorting domain-containing protein [Phaeodactylibacter sp.]|nr:T9SS type A sorting domain-containing protein [Phaeodactylibacter sp.]MCB9050574.1 T9SS type A sorting domain-containing protein [Lewinellaceae bacterium]